MKSTIRIINLIHQKLRSKRIFQIFLRRKSFFAGNNWVSTTQHPHIVFVNMKKKLNVNIIFDTVQKDLLNCNKPQIQKQFITKYADYPYWIHEAGILIRKNAPNKKSLKASLCTTCEINSQTHKFFTCEGVAGGCEHIYNRIDFYNVITSLSMATANIPILMAKIQPVARPLRFHPNRSVPFPNCFYLMYVIIVCTFRIIAHISAIHTTINKLSINSLFFHLHYWHGCKIEEKLLK